MNVTNARWHDTYHYLAQKIRSGAPKAQCILTVSNACVDAIFRIDAARLSRLSTSPAQRTERDDKKGAELLDRVLARITSGRGGELVIPWPNGPRWLSALLGPPDYHQVGGTAPQASWALATVGANSVLALADRSAEQLAVIDSRVSLCTGETVVPVGSLIPSGSPTKLPHYILEFTRGTSSGALTVPRSSRIILRFGDEPIERDENFFRMAPTLAASAGAGLLSGENNASDNDRRDRDWITAVADAWSKAGIGVVHHELAEFRTVTSLREAASLTPVTSLGLSLSELYTLVGSQGDPRFLACDVAVRYGTQRVIVHADEWALSVHRGNPDHEKQVLLVGNAFGAARAQNGVPAAILEPTAEVNYTDDLPVSGPLGGGWVATCVPAPYLNKPASTVGLGDTFTAGVLLAESLTV